MSNFEIGDIVKIIDSGERYSTHVSKVLEMYYDDCSLPSNYRKFKEEYLVRFAYAGEEFPLKNIPNKYEILYLYENFALIQAIEDFYKRVYLIGIPGIEKIKSKKRIYLEENFTKDQLIDMVEQFFEVKEIENERPE